MNSKGHFGVGDILDNWSNELRILHSADVWKIGEEEKKQITSEVSAK